jgi:hypothetical protein
MSDDPALGPELPSEKSALGADLIIPVLAAGLTIYFLVSTRSMAWEARANGTVIGVGLLAMIALHLGRLVLGFRRGEARLGFGDLLERSPVQAQRVGLLLILVVFIALVPWLGTTLGVFLSLLALMLTLGVRSWRRLLLISLAVATTVYLLFMLLLQSRLPSGPVEEALGRLFGGGS